MHHFAFHSLNSESHQFSFSIKVKLFQKWSDCPRLKSTRTYATRANKKREHIRLNKKSTNIREEVTTLQAELERLSTLVVSLVASQGQPQFQQRPKRQHQQAPRMQFDPIPMTYAELLPILLQKNLVQTRVPPQVPNELPVWYQPDLSCAFHQGAPDHDGEHCRSLKIEVQKLIKANILLFEG